MADRINAKNTDAKFKAHDEGQFVAQCVDAIDLGEKVEQYGDTPEKLSHKCALVFRTGEKNPETNEYIDISKEFTVSMGDLANLRKFLEQWRGKPYSEGECSDGVPLDKLEGQWALLTIAHKASQKGRTYALIMTVSGVPKVMQASLPTFGKYERAKYWEDRKKEYASASRAFRDKYEGKKAVDDETFEDFHADDGEDSDLPFS